MDRNIDNSGIVSNILTIISEKKWTKKRFAEETGISVKTLSRWIKNLNEPTDDKLEQISEATGYAYGWVAALEEQPKFIKDEWLYYNQTREWGLRGLNGLYERIQELLDLEEITPKQLIHLANLDLSNSGHCKDWHFIGDNPTAENILKICEMFGYRKEWLWDGEGKPKKTPTKITEPHPLSPDSSATQIINKGSKNKNAGGNMTINKGSEEPLQLTTLERAAIERNRKFGSDDKLIEFMGSLTNKQ